VSLKEWQRASDKTRRILTHLRFGTNADWPSLLDSSTVGREIIREIFTPLEVESENKIIESPPQKLGGIKLGCKDPTTLGGCQVSTATHLGG
jgi:hypothetical protein